MVADAAQGWARKLRLSDRSSRRALSGRPQAPSCTHEDQDDDRACRRSTARRCSGRPAHRQPRNPRDELGDLSDLATIADRQLQPGTVVSRTAWLKLWPEDEDDIGAAQYIVVNGNRRLAAAQKYGRPGLDVVLRDSIAVDKGEILWAATSENIDRRDFDVLEEAKAVELMVSEFGSADAAAKKLGRSKGWVSQRRALLKLAPELQAALRAGDLAVRQARSLARVPLEEQVAAWEAAQNPQPEPEADAEAPEPEAPQSKEPATKLEPVDKVAQALKRLGADPDVLAAAVRKHFTDDERRKLIDALELR